MTTPHGAPQRSPALSVGWVVLAIAAAKLALHLLTANRYGLFRDEMYGLACAEHLDWGYVDHPPGGILIAWVAGHLFGHSLLGLRLLPALGGAATIWLAGVVARELGGGKSAAAIAALAVACVPMYTVFDHWLMMNAFEPLLWLAGAGCVIRGINTGSGKAWLGFGILVGVTVEMKYTVVFLAAGVLVGLLLTVQRGALRQWHLWCGLAIGVLIALPNFLWQLRHRFPFLELMHNVAASHRDVVRSPVPFLLDQMVIMQPVLAPLWIGGVVTLLGGRLRKYAAVGWAAVFVGTAVIALQGKNYYLTPIYPVLFAAGAVALERVTASARGRAIRSAYAGLVVICTLVLLPIFSPVLSPDAFVRYARALHLAPPDFEHQNNGPLPQYFADEFGWEEMVREVARVYHALTPSEQARTTIFSNGWGEAAAVDFYGPRYGLPRAISKHNSYWLWGPGRTQDIFIVLRTDGVGDRRHFKSVEAVGHVSHPYSRRDEWFDIYLCRGPEFDLAAEWPRMKLFD